MPNYVIGEGSFQKRPPFKNAHHMSKFLTRTSKNDNYWQKGFVNTAEKYLSGELVPNVKLRRDALKRITKRHPYQLGGDVLLDFMHQGEEEGSYKGSGIPEAINTIAHTALNLTGLPKLKEVLFGEADHKQITDEQRLFAKALQDTYKPINERKENIGKLKRLSQFDNDRYSVYDEGNGQLLVTIHGTKMNLSDLKDDAEILLGKTNVQDKAVTSLFKVLDEHNISFDVAGHSLGTEFIMNGLQKDEHVDKIMLFNPASSGLQDSKLLNERANNPKYSYFINNFRERFPCRLKLPILIKNT